MTNELVNQIERIFWPTQTGRHAWMIVDAARDERIFPMLLECHLEYSCLYSGTLPPLLSMAAPYLVHLEYEYRDTRRFVRRGWGNSWGVFLNCDQSLKILRRHLRELLTVRDFSGQQLLFRFYDPRVLRTYLPTCTSNELHTVFGPVQGFWTEDHVPDTLLAFRFTGQTLVQERIELTSGEQARTISPQHAEAFT